MSKFKITIQNSKLRKILTFLLVFLTFYLYSLTFVYAHVLESDGTVGATLHISPDDDPVAGELSGFFFEFKDKLNQFKPENCDCIVSISANNREIFSQPLYLGNNEPSLTNASLFYTFPTKGIYQLKVVGIPKSPGSFQNFTLKYDIRVQRETINAGNTTATQPKSWLQTHTIYLIGAVVALTFFLYAFLKQNRK
jgi:hypothetical protein